nr:class I SAM-dependent methyltransferase [Acinetobacter sp. Marseille-Q1620]
MKDLFSDHSELYSQARPSYPVSIVQEILKLVPEHHFAWDCGAGSGQFTQVLAPYFDHVVATDISEQQLQHATYLENVSYQVQSAEQTTFADHSFDLISVAQAIHWFDFKKFYKEVERTLKPDGILAVIGYGLIHVEPLELNQHIQKLYFETLKDDWDVERHYIDESYKTIPFPFEEIEMPVLKMQYQWSARQLLDYLSTWSAIKHYRKKNIDNPLIFIEQYLECTSQPISVEFPVLFRCGKVSPKKQKKVLRKGSK